MSCVESVRGVYPPAVGSRLRSLVPTKPPLFRIRAIQSEHPVGASSRSFQPEHPVGACARSIREGREKGLAPSSFQISHPSYCRSMTRAMNFKRRAAADAAKGAGSTTLLMTGVGTASASSSWDESSGGCRLPYQKSRNRRVLTAPNLHSVLRYERWPER
jgi:hypothetical protein